MSEPTYVVEIHIVAPEDDADVNGPIFRISGSSWAYYVEDSELHDVTVDSVKVWIDDEEIPDNQIILNRKRGDWWCEAYAGMSGTLLIKAEVTATFDTIGSKDDRDEVSVQMAIPEFQFATWSRLEPRCRSKDFARGLEARTADPLWMLTRQWQTGEFQAEDTGSPLQVDMKYATQSVDRVRLGHTSESINFSGQPLEMVVERERLELDWRIRAQIGQQFERLLRTTLATDPELAGAVVGAYREKCPLRLPDQGEGAGVDQATARLLEFLAGRVVDGQTLLCGVDFSDNNDHDVPALGGITNEQLQDVLDKLKSWCAKLDIRPQPTGSAAWRNEQLDYRFELNPPTPERERTRLVAPNYLNGALDWYTFNVAGPVQGGWRNASTATVPTRITVGGMSPRWWAFEDAALHVGGLDVATPDLAKLVLIEFMLIYGDDWFTVPLPVTMSNLVKMDEMMVHNVFGDQVLVEPARKITQDPRRRWELFTLSPALDFDPPGVGDPNHPGVGDLLFLPPAVGFRQESPPLEEVRFLRDEGANMVWAVEHTVRNGLGRPVAGFDAQRERLARERQAEIARLEEALTDLERQLASDDLTDEDRAALTAAAQEINNQLVRLREGSKLKSGDLPRYRLATTVPENWIPFLPAVPSHTPIIHLRRAQMLKNTNDEQPSPITAMSHLLESKGRPLLWLEEDSVPRSGLRLQLTAQRVGWIDGKTYVWLGRKVLTGSGEGSSGLTFDVLSQAGNK